ncbi:MAG: branched-chain amino acid ABC transporter permease [Pseudomonadota bacterium]
MEKTLQPLVDGLSHGSLYALVALGLVFVYRSSRVLNFGHGAVSTAGTYLAFFLLSRNVSFWLAFSLALLFGGGISMMFYILVLKPAQRRDATTLGQIILTLGMGLVLEALIIHFGGSETQTFPFPLSDTKTYQFGGVVITQLNLGTLITGLLACGIFYFLIQKTPIGLAIRATSENLTAAQTLGIRTHRMLALAWNLAAVLGVLSGLFLAPTFLLDPVFMLEPFLKGIAAATLGGLNSLPGAIVGGLILGVAEGLVGGYISVAFKNSLAFLIILVVLLLKPEGLLGKVFVERV